MMRFAFYLLFLVFIFVGCRKGKNLPDVIYVHYEGPTIAHQYPTDAFDKFDPYDFDEPLQYPDYIYLSDSDDLANEFNETLIRLLEKNNIILTTEPAEYTLHIGSLSVGEGLNRHSYVDSCASIWDTEPSYVYYSDLSASVTATLRKNGAYINDWNRNATSSEKVRDKTDGCNCPKIRSIWRKPSSLVSQLASEIRMKVSRQIYDLEVE